ncbi:uncharacterized protein K441DRAFT_11416 [Cenococcum geophilum 1.58]|uniref:uncharacterized protein n=1 Tax=Cenococcum geophilum 1.58 TaxID=794803 RepID=UPI00358F710A|nr:hypothetical protein K441DRAFT_11416 [Cenococcum geophilum 1.58]
MACVQWRRHGVERSFPWLVLFHGSSLRTCTRLDWNRAQRAETQLLRAISSEPKQVYFELPGLFHHYLSRAQHKGASIFFFMREREVSEDCRSSHQMPAPCEPSEPFRRYYFP